MTPCGSPPMSRAMAVRSRTPRRLVRSSTYRPAKRRRGLPSTRNRTPCGAAGNTGHGRPAAANCWPISRILFRSAPPYNRQHAKEDKLTKSILCRAGATALCLLAASIPAQADAVADFYKGKTVSLIAGFPPGGGYDTYVRVLARHYGRFIPGQPLVVASNLPGAGSLNAANQIYNKTAADGLTLAMFASSAAMEPLLGNKAALFDATKFSWVGSMSNDVAFCGVWQGPGSATNFDEMLTKETIWGGGAPAAITYQHPMVLKNVLHAKIKVIPGYAGSRDINLAMQRGEVHGACGLFGSSIRSSFNNEVQSGQLKIVIQMGNKRSDDF